MLARLIALALAFVLVACGGVASPQVSTEATSPPTAPPAAQATATSEPTEAPTSTPEPTNTPEPTDTPEPTATPTELPTPTPPPEPVVFEGSGQTVTDPFTPPGQLTRVVATHAGERNFIVYAHSEDGDETLVANAVGDYSGSRLLLSNGPVFLEVKGDGVWTVRVEPLSDEPAAATELRGTGDYVSGLFPSPAEGAVPYLFSHTGKRNFIVRVYCAGGDDLAENEVGAVTDSASVVRFEEGPCLWEVQADGEWSLRKR